MTRIGDALSSLKERLSDYYTRFVDWTGLDKKWYRFKKRFKRYKLYVKDNLATYGKAYSKYFLFEFAPFVVAYGVMLNFPVAVLLGWVLSVETVVAWGLVFYFVSEELTSVANELKPYIRISAKVDN